MSKKVMISAGEASGELYGAMVSRELKKSWPDIEIFGIGGSRMKEEGVSVIAPISQTIGIVEVIKHLWELYQSLRKAREALIRNRPDILVLIDYPDFNLSLAKTAKSAGIPVLYYVSPQVWAWRARRVKKIASLVKKIAVLFPFEVDCYKDTGLDCEFVGHPMTEIIDINRTKEELKNNLALDPARDVVTLLPGSRPTEIARHKQIIIDLARRINNDFPGIQIVVPLASGTTISEGLPSYVRIIHDHTTEAVACSEVSAVASGTATLETALLGIPMVVYYKIAPVSYAIGKLLINVEFISLANILSGKEVVRELIQNEADPENIFNELKRILIDSSYRDTMRSNLNKIKQIMEDKRPSERVALIIGEIAGWKCCSTVSSPQ